MFRQILRVAAVIARGTTLLGLVAHFTLTLLYVLPPNPIKLEYGFLASVTIGTYFPQNWSLFAPTPVQSTQSLLVRCLGPAEAPKSSLEKLPEDGWRDVSLAHFHQAQAHRFSAYERTVRPLQNALRRFLHGGPDLEPFAKACEKGDEEACKARESALAPRRAGASRMLRSIASAYCRETVSSDKLVGVAVRFRERGAIPWSERATSAPDVRDFEVGVFSVDQDIRLPGLYGEEEEPS